MEQDGIFTDNGSTIPNKLDAILQNLSISELKQFINRAYQIKSSKEPKKIPVNHWELGLYNNKTQLEDEQHFPYTAEGLALAKQTALEYISNIPIVEPTEEEDSDYAVSIKWGQHYVVEGDNGTP